VYAYAYRLFSYDFDHSFSILPMSAGGGHADRVRELHPQFTIRRSESDLTNDLIFPVVICFKVILLLLLQLFWLSVLIETYPLIASVTGCYATVATVGHL